MGITINAMPMGCACNRFTLICERCVKSVVLSIQSLTLILVLSAVLCRKRATQSAKKAEPIAMYLLKYMNIVNLFISYAGWKSDNNGSSDNDIGATITATPKRNKKQMLKQRYKNYFTHSPVRIIMWHLYELCVMRLYAFQQITLGRTQFYCVSLNINFNCREFSCRA